MARVGLGTLASLTAFALTLIWSAFVEASPNARPPQVANAGTVACPIDDPGSPAPRQAKGPYFKYDGFVVDICGIQVGDDRDEMLTALRGQVDIVKTVNLSQDTLTFFRSIYVWVAPPEGRRVTSDYSIFGSAKSSSTSSIIVRLNDSSVWRQPDAPVLLHELLHAYHFKKLTDGFLNREIAALFQQALDGGQFPRDAKMLTNPMEYFAQMSVIYLRGTGGRDPFTRENIKNKQPDVYRWLEKEFGPR